MKTLEERLESKIDRTPGRGPNGDCWIWTACLDAYGYGAISYLRRTLKAHRVTFFLAGKHIPEGMELDHLCRVRSCVNPEHLEAVTHRVNMDRGEIATAKIAGIKAKMLLRTHCMRGHEYTPQNTELRTGNGRRCVICRNEYCRAWHSRKKAITLNEQF